MPTSVPALLLTLTQGSAGLWEFSHSAVRIFTQCFDGAPNVCTAKAFPFDPAGLLLAGNGNPKLERQEQRLGCSTVRQSSQSFSGVLLWFTVLLPVRQNDPRNHTKPDKQNALLRVFRGSFYLTER